jgi:hypothetical protein
MSSRDDEYTEYISARMMSLRRTAFMLCQDWHRADDLVQAAITKLYLHWSRARAASHIDAYARTVLVHEFLGERRSAWARRVRLGGQVTPAGARSCARSSSACPARTPRSPGSTSGWPGSAAAGSCGSAARCCPAVIRGHVPDLRRARPRPLPSVSTYGNETPGAVTIFRNHLRLLGPGRSRWTARPLG